MDIEAGFVKLSEAIQDRQAGNYREEKHHELFDRQIIMAHIDM